MFLSRAFSSGLILSLAALLVGCPVIPAEPGAAPSVPAASPSSSPAGSNLSGAFLFYEDFEHGTQKWDFSITDPIAWRILATHSCGGAFAMLFGAANQIMFSATVTDAYLTLHDPVDLGTAQHPWLTYEVLGQANPPTALTLQPEASGADGVWKPLGQMVQGTYDTMGTVTVDLAAYAGQSPHLRFHATSQAPGSSTGMLLDAIEIVNPS